MRSSPACTWGAAATIAAALFLGSPASAFAHDPGLSALDVRVEPRRIIATLFLAAVDARLPLGPDLIELRLDGVPLESRLEGRERDAKNGVRLVLSFERVAGATLVIRSLVPARLAGGHRELLTVRGSDEQLIGERMFDARDAELSLDLAAAPNGTGTAFELIALGVRHILGGYDHLLFLAALLLGVRRFASVIRTVTAFTAAHSLTLALAALGLVRLPSAIVEPVIAASIVFVGLENLFRGDVESRWKLTFAFGLVHGFGFAGALEELGLGTRLADIVTALGSFNAGVELGQMAVVAMLWPALRYVNARPALRLRVAPMCSVVVVAAGAYWLVLRTL